MAIKVYLGKQAKEKQAVEDSALIDAGATDFSVEESIQELKSERFQDIQAQGDSTISKIEVQGSIPIEFSKEILEELMPSISYAKTELAYKMGTEQPSFYTIVLTDTATNERWDYLDCVISNLKVNIALGGYINGSIDVIGKTYEIKSGAVKGAKPAGDILRALHAAIELDSKDISSDVEGVEITVDNGMEAKGSLNSLYNTKFRRATPQNTAVSIQKNAYDAAQFKAMKEKMIAGTATKATIKLGTAKEKDTIIIEIPKMFINSNKRGDYKGAGTHNVDLTCSVNNAENSHLKITFKGGK